MIRFSAGIEDFTLDGAKWSELDAQFRGFDPIRQIERASIRAFMEKHRALLMGRVLDYGAGEQPYRDLVSGQYVPFEKGEKLPGGAFDAVICNQVAQYLDDPAEQIAWMKPLLRRDGYLVMTYATNWDEVEEADYWRFTKAGMERLLAKAGFIVEVHKLRAAVKIGSFSFPLGYGVVCTRS